MAREFYQFSKKHFEYQLKGILIRNKAGFMEDITEQWNQESDDPSWEHIYKISTKNKSVDIIIFSSVDKRTGKVRDIGGDAVRVVTRWVTKNGPVYKSLGKHYRLKTLFNNLETTIINAQLNVFNLNYKEFAVKVS